MGLFDLFKKKDAAFFLARALKDLERQEFAYARDDCAEGLAKKPLEPDMEAALRDALSKALKGLCERNLEEVNLCLTAGDVARARECLETARLYANGEEAILARLDALANEIKDFKKRSKEITPTVVSGDVPREPDEDPLADQFQVYLTSLAPDVADIYSTLGREFMEAYVALSSGEAQRALELLNTFKPGSEDVMALLAFERARALLLLGDARQALHFLDVTAALRGATPVFLSNHPSISFLRFECLLLLGQQDEAIQALRDGLKVHPDDQTLRNTLASFLLASGQFEEAEPLISTALSCSRGDPNVHLLNARLLVEKGESQAAMAALEQGIRSCGCSPSALPHPDLARALAELHIQTKSDPNRAETLLLQALQAQGGEALWNDHFLRGALCTWQGDLEGARREATLALQALPDPADPRRRRVEAMLGE